ncbi:MAG: hypothetical protein PVF57_16490 [Pseudomonadales bacterium]|jgi:hypothetical protein
MSELTDDALDSLLDEAFRRSLDEAPTPADLAMIDTVMRRIRQRQRLRWLVFGCVGTVAMAICAVSVLPLVNEVLEVAAGMEATDWHAALPLALLAASLVFGGWFLVEDPV